MVLERILKFLNFKLFFFISLSLSLIGLFTVLSEVFLLERFLDFVGLEIEFLENLPISFFFLPLIFWNIPLLLMIIAWVIYKK
tara:strand:- start:111 stop:359 length:249 start_codon:yes stop_codon:yes gene_type:complete